MFLIHYLTLNFKQTKNTIKMLNIRHIISNTKAKIRGILIV